MHQAIKNTVVYRALHFACSENGTCIFKNIFWAQTTETFCNKFLIVRKLKVLYGLRAQENILQ